MTNQQLTVIDGQAVAVKTELSVPDILQQVQRIQAVMKAAMKEGEHYGVIPGTKKPSLLKAGAEKLLLTFRLDPQYEVITATETDERIAYTVRCTLYHIPTGERIASGVGACNSREKKYEYANPWHIQNTILKMASKRAMVGAVLNGTAASDIFTQDLEDMPKDGQAQRPPVRSRQQPVETRPPVITMPHPTLVVPSDEVAEDGINSFPEAGDDGHPPLPHPRATFIERDTDGDFSPYFDLDGVLFCVEATRKGPVWATADLCTEHGTRYFARPIDAGSKHSPVFLCKGDGQAHPYVAPGDDL